MPSVSEGTLDSLSEVALALKGDRRPLGAESESPRFRVFCFSGFGVWGFSLLRVDSHFLAHLRSRRQHQLRIEETTTFSVHSGWGSGMLRGKLSYPESEALRACPPPPPVTTRAQVWSMEDVVERKKPSRLAPKAAESPWLLRAAEAFLAV